MPEKSTTFEQVRFGPKVVKAAREVLLEISRETPWNDARLVGPPTVPVHDQRMRVARGQNRLTHDTFDEFIAALREPFDDASAIFYDENSGIQVKIHITSRQSVIEVGAQTEAIVERLMSIFEDAREEYRIRVLEPATPKKPTIFIGHGRSDAWQSLREVLRDDFSYAVEAYETQERTGHAIQRVLDDMLAASQFAVLVLTAEDEQPDLSTRARQNVIHEAWTVPGAPRRRAGHPPRRGGRGLPQQPCWTPAHQVRARPHRRRSGEGPQCAEAGVPDLAGRASPPPGGEQPWPHSAARCPGGRARGTVGANRCHVPSTATQEHSWRFAAPP